MFILYLHLPGINYVALEFHRLLFILRIIKINFQHVPYNTFPKVMKSDYFLESDLIIFALENYFLNNFFFYQRRAVWH